MTTGRIIERDNGYGYVISAGRDPLTGKYKQIWRTGFKTKTEAREKLRQHLNELDTGNAPVDITVAEWLKRWLKEDCADMKPTTIKSYTSCVNHHLIPNVGKIRLDKLSHSDIQRLYTKLEKSLSSVTVHKVHRCLRAALNRSIKRGYLKESPMTRVDSPERRSPKRRTLSVQQAQQMLSWLKQQRSIAYYGAYLAIYGGLRLGEVCGLKWKDVDVESQTIYIRRARQRHKKQDILIEPKTSDSIRDIVLPEFVIEEMETWKEWQKERSHYLGKPWDEETFVVLTLDMKPPDPHIFAKDVKSALTALKAPIVTFHDLRHTHATWLLESGVDLKTVSQRLGHSSITVTADVYSHVTRRMQKDAVNKLEKMMQEK
jgi:integrase